MTENDPIPVSLELRLPAHVEGMELQGAWLSPFVLLTHMKVAEDHPAPSLGQTNAEPQDADRDPPAGAPELRELLLTLGDRLRSKGICLPAVALIECGSESVYEDWRRIAGTQDWHRGDFSILPVRPGGNCQETREWLLSSRLAAAPITLEPLVPEDYARSVEAAIPGIKDKDAQVVELYTDLLRRVAEAVRSDQAPQMAMEGWLNAVRERVQTAVASATTPKEGATNG